MSEDVDEYLAHQGIKIGAELKHYGKKGMKWGVRNEDDLLGLSTSGPTPANRADRRQYVAQAKRIRAELKKRGFTELDSAVLKAKYETPEGEDPAKGLSKNQKIAIGVGVGVVAAAAIGFAAYKGGLFDSSSPISEIVKDGFDQETLIKRFAEKPASASLFDTKYKAYAEAADGLKINWDNDVKLSAGSILKRVSSKAETAARADGFFACFRDEDVKSYSAILPTFWAQWKVGTPMDGGFINHYKAVSDVKAPSGKETLAIFKGLMESNASFRASVGLGFDRWSTLTDGEHHEVLKAFAQGWVNGMDNTTFFNAVKEKGYNALIDFNDAGTLGKTPLRLLDGTMFEIVNNEVLSFENMLQAATEWAPSLIHYFLGRMNMSTEVDAFLAHYGVEADDELKHYGKKGMKWGKRTARDSSDTPAGPSRREARAAKNEEINQARARQRLRADDLERQAFRTYTANGEKALKAAVNKYDKMEADLLTNPDSATAAKMTSGEKVAAAVNGTILVASVVTIGALSLRR